MKTKKYKTIKGLLSQCTYRNLSFNDFTARQFYHDKTREWCHFTLPENELEKAARLYASAVYDRVTRRQVENVLYYRGRSYGILNRLTITCRHSNEVKGDYCVGQDGEAETKILQRIFRN